MQLVSAPFDTTLQAKREKAGDSNTIDESESAYIIAHYPSRFYCPKMPQNAQTNTTIIEFMVE